MKNITLTSTAVLLMTISSVSSAKIYKWVDENGQLCYTERPAPAGKKATVIEDKIRVAANLARKNRSPSSYIPSARENDDEKIKEEAEEKKLDKIAAKQKAAQDNYREQLESYCSSQRENIKQLKTASPIAWEENGKTELLSGEEKKAKLAEISESVSKNCSKSDKKTNGN